MVSASVRDATHPRTRVTANKINSAPNAMRQEGGEQFPDDAVKKTKLLYYGKLGKSTSLSTI